MKKAYWKKVEELVRLRRSMREAALPYIPVDEHTVDEIYDQDNLDVDEYDMDQEDGAPKVNLKYPLDYETVRNLPSKRMKRASRKEGDRVGPESPALSDYHFGSTCSTSGC